MTSILWWCAFALIIAMGIRALVRSGGVYTPAPASTPQARTDADSAADVPEYPTLYLILLGLGGTIMAGLAITAWKVWGSMLHEEERLGITFDAGPTIVLFVATYLVLSLKEVPANQVAGAFFYGKALSRLEPGLQFVPFGLMQVRAAPREVQQFQCPGEPEMVQKGDDKIPLESSGKVRPIRAVTRAARDGETDVLDTRMTLELNFVVQYAITDIFDFIANYGNKEVIEKQLRDIGETTLAEEVVMNTPRTLLERLPEINTSLVLKIKERFRNAGVDIISARLISPDITHRVSEALADTPIEREKAKQAVIRGEGAAQVELSLLSARAQGRKKMKEALEVTGADVLAAEATRDVLEKTDVLVVGAEGGMRDVMGLVKGAQSALNSSKGKGSQS